MPYRKLIVFSLLLLLTSFGVGSSAMAATSSSVEVSIGTDGNSAVATDFPADVTNYKHLIKGTARNYEDIDYGYRFLQQTPGGVQAIAMADRVVVYIDPTDAQNVGLELTDKNTAVIVSMLKTLDVAHDLGGDLIGDLLDSGAKLEITSERTYSDGDFEYIFGQEIESGYYYACIKVLQESALADVDISSRVLFADTADIVASGSVVAAGESTILSSIWDFFTALDWRPLWVSVRTTMVASLIVFSTGLIVAWRITEMGDRTRSVWDSILTIPMVLPPTVMGLLLLLLFGQSTGFGRWLESMGVNVVFAWAGCVIASCVVSFPLMYRSARGAFESLDTNMLDAARTLGWSEWRIFTRLMLPVASPSIASGAVLAFARALGEFGATLFVAGNYAGVTQTIPLAIYFDWMGGDTSSAIFWSIVIIVVSFITIALVNMLGRRSQDYRYGGKRGTIR